MLSRPVSAATAELISRLLRVAGQPVRVMLIDTLERVGEASVDDLAAAAGVTVANASQHLAVLRGAGIVRRRDVGRQRLYRLVEPGDVFALYEQARVSLRRRADAEVAQPPASSSRRRATVCCRQRMT